MTQRYGITIVLGGQRVRLWRDGKPVTGTRVEMLRELCRMWPEDADAARLVKLVRKKKTAHTWRPMTELPDKFPCYAGCLVKSVYSGFFLQFYLFDSESDFTGIGVYGDYVAWTPLPADTLDRLRAAEAVKP